MRRHLVVGLVWAVAAVAAVALAAWKPLARTRATAAQPLTVAAASDLHAALPEVGGAWMRRSGETVQFTFGASGDLARQIEQGAPVDLFLAADESYVEKLCAAGLLLPDTQRVYARGRLALATPRRTKVAVRSLADLLLPAVRHVAIANPTHAPYGRAAREALQEAGIWQQVQNRLVFASNVRQATQMVETGNADAGIIALAGAEEAEIEWTTLDDGLYRPLRQTLAVVNRAPHAQAARDFAHFLCGPAGRRILARHGFALPPK